MKPALCFVFAILAFLASIYVAKASGRVHDMRSADIAPFDTILALMGSAFLILIAIALLVLAVVAIVAIALFDIPT